MFVLAAEAFGMWERKSPGPQPRAYSAALCRKQKYLPNLLDVKPEPDQHKRDGDEADAQADAAMIALDHCILAGLQFAAAIFMPD